jgi:hypothetical protein
LPEGTILRFAAEIARNLNDGEELRVLPIVTPGAVDNLNDLLYLRGVDLAIVHSDVLQHFRGRGKDDSGVSNYAAGVSPESTRARDDRGGARRWAPTPLRDSGCSARRQPGPDRNRARKPLAIEAELTDLTRCGSKRMQIDAA